MNIDLNNDLTIYTYLYTLIVNEGIKMEGLEVIKWKD